jgi:protein MpaA
VWADAIMRAMTLLTIRRAWTRLALASLALLVSACAAPGSKGAVAAEPAVDRGWEVIGTSAEGRPVRARTLGRGGRHIALIAGIHGDETEGLQHVEELVALCAEAAANVRFFEDISPDGTARGTRHTASGVDPNRNWPAKNFSPAPTRGPRPLSEPEIAAAHAELVRFSPELVIVLHSTKRGPFVNFDGPARELADLFARAAGPPWKVVADMGYATPGSFGSWMGVDRGVPTLTVELQRGAPASASGPALARAIPAVIEAFVGRAAGNASGSDFYVR